MIYVLKRAKLRPTDVAKLLKVSRVAVSLWFNNHTKPHSMIVERLDKLVQAVESALQDGDLPLSVDVPRRERHMRLSKIITEHIAK